MNYTELSTAIQDYCVNSETAFLAHLNEFIITTEDKIFSAVNGPLFWKASTSVSTVDGTNEYTLASGTIDVLGIRICETASGSISTGGPFRYLLRKEIDFLFEAFPGTQAGGLEKGIPKYYSVTSAAASASDPTLNIRMGPTPDDIYNTEIEYYGKSQSDSITIGSTPALPLTTETWISVAFPDVLLWGSIVQGYAFMKGDADIMSMYESKFNEGLLLLKNTSESRQDTDTYSDQGAGAQQG